jgi:hypothetical protein
LTYQHNIKDLFTYSNTLKYADLAVLRANNLLSHLVTKHDLKKLMGLVKNRRDIIVHYQLLFIMPTLHLHSVIGRIIIGKIIGLALGVAVMLVSPAFGFPVFSMFGIGTLLSLMRLLIQLCNQVSFLGWDWSLRFGL